MRFLFGTNEDVEEVRQPVVDILRLPAMKLLDQPVVVDEATAETPLPVLIKIGAGQERHGQKHLVGVPVVGLPRLHVEDDVVVLAEGEEVGLPADHDARGLFVAGAEPVLVLDLHAVAGGIEALVRLAQEPRVVDFPHGEVEVALDSLEVLPVRLEPEGPFTALLAADPAGEQRDEDVRFVSLNSHGVSAQEAAALGRRASSSPRGARETSTF